MKRRLIIIIAMVIVSILHLSVSAAAVGMPDLTRQCSLTIDMKYGAVSIAGAPVTIYHVADMVLNSADLELAYTGDFAGCGGDLTAIDTTEGNKALAATLLAYVQANAIVPAEGHSKVTDADGHATFTQLKAGLYMVVTGPIEGYEDMAPYVLLIPILADGETWTYDILAEPKTEIVPTPTPTSTPTPTATPTPTPKPTYTPTPTTPPLPQTGVLMWPIPVLAAGGVLLIVIGWIYFYKARNKE